MKVCLIRLVYNDGIVGGMLIQHEVLQYKCLLNSTSIIQALIIILILEAFHKLSSIEACEYSLHRNSVINATPPFYSFHTRTSSNELVMYLQ